MSLADLGAGGKRVSTLDEVRQAAARVHAAADACNRAWEPNDTWWETFRVPGAENLTIRQMMWEAVVWEADTPSAPSSGCVLREMISTVRGFYAVESANADPRLIEAVARSVLREVEALRWNRVRAQVRWTMRQLDRAM